MKKWFLLWLLVPGFQLIHAQNNAAQVEAPFRRFPSIPAFKILKVDSSSYFTKDDLRKGHLTMIMFFSPSCEHCKHQTQDMLAEFDKFKNIEIVMATYQPFEEMKEFYSYFRIADHPNIKLGRDEKYFFPPYYRMQSLPFIALYDKNGNLITTFEGNQKVATLLTAFHSKD
jgi:thiol-disulfide isomerase/thioredoxin